MSDITLNLKLLNSLYKFYTQKQGEMPVYFGNDISEFIGADTSENIKASKGSIDLTKLDSMVKNLCEDSDTALAGFGIMMDGGLVKEYYASPFSKEYRHVSYSVCKTVVALAVGIACDKKLLSVDAKLSSIFPEHNKIFMKKNMKQITIKHLLTMTAGVNFDEISAFFSYDWRKDYMGSNVMFPPGNAFYYNSLNSYMLSACIGKITGKSLMEFLEENLFRPMHINDITWDKCPMGVERGGWGMKLSLRDMLKIGQLILDKGVWDCDGEKRRLVSKNWIDDMLTPQVEVKDKKLVSGYGYGIWIMKDGSYLLNGVFGQNVYINPHRNMVIATLGAAHELFPDGRLMDDISKFSVEDNNFKKKKSLPDLKYYGEKFLQIMKKKNKSLSDIKSKLNIYLGNVYKFSEYASSVLPLSTQVIYSNFLSGMESISFDISGEDFFVKIKDSDIDIKLKMGYSDIRPYEYQILNINGKNMPVAVSAKLLYDEDSRLLLKIHVVYLEDVGSRIFKIYFNEDSIRLKSYETPDLMRFMGKFIGDDRLWRAKAFKDFVPSDYIEYKIKKILSPDVTGCIDE